MSVEFDTQTSIEPYEPTVEVEEFSRTREFIAMGQRLVGRAALVIGLASGVVAGEMIVTPPAAVADTGGYPDYDAAGCGADTWCKGGTDISPRGYGFRNCTDWDAFRIPQVTQVAVPTGLGNANTWDDRINWTKTSVPEPGDVAQSDGGSVGHVGVVESYVKNASGAVTSINVSEYNRDHAGTYSMNTYYADASGIFWRNGDHTKKWDHFLDPNGVGKGINGADLDPTQGSTPPPPPDYFIKRGGSVVYGKQRLDDGWTTLTSNAVDVEADGDRFAYKNSNNEVYAKEGGLSAGWVFEGGADQFKVTSDYFVKQVGSVVLGKHNLDDAWTTLTSNAVGFQVAGDRFAYQNSSGEVYVKEGTLDAPWIFEGGADQYKVSADYFLKRSGNVVYAKQNLDDPWTILTSNAVDMDVAGDRIAYKNPSNEVYVKQGGLSEDWIFEGGADQFALSPQYFLKRSGSVVYGKQRLDDTWTTLTSNAVDIAAAGNRIAYKNPSGQVYVKEGSISAAWVLEGGADKYILTSGLPE